MAKSNLKQPANKCSDCEYIQHLKNIGANGEFLLGFCPKKQRYMLLSYEYCELFKKSFVFKNK